MRSISCGIVLRTAATLLTIINSRLLVTAMSTARTTSTASAPAASSSVKLPKLIAFDLDGTIWTPDMYQLWGGGAPFKPDGDGTKKLYDRQGTAVKLLGISSRILQDLKTDKKWSDTIVAWVSCTDEPDWADSCMKLFKTAEGRSIGDYIDSSQIYKANKQVHFQKLKSEYKSIDYTDMLFFDNEMGNIRSVSKLGVQCVYCPDGMTEDIWNEGLKKFKI